MDPKLKPPKDGLGASLGLDSPDLVDSLGFDPKLKPLDGLGASADLVDSVALNPKLKPLDG